MITNNQLTTAEFIAEIDKFNNEKVWKNDHLGVKIATFFMEGFTWTGLTTKSPREEELSVQKVNSFVTLHIDHIESCIHDAISRRKLADLAIRLTDHFPATASLINFYVNSIFFNVTDIVKHIFSYILPDCMYRHITMLKTQRSVSKCFRIAANIAINEWVKKKYIPLKDAYGVKTAEQALQCITKHNLIEINLLGLNDFPQSDLKSLSIAQKIRKLTIECEGKAEWPKMGSLIDLDIKGVTDEQLIAISKACPKLQIIKLGALFTKYAVSDKGFLELVNGCLELQSINCHHNTRLLFENLPEFAAPQLKTINLSYTKINDKGLIKIANGCKNLQDIDLVNVNITDIGIVELSKKCSQLKHIKLEENRFTGKSLNSLLKNCTVLESASFQYLTIGDGDIQELSALKHSTLKTLYITRSNLTDKHFAILAKILPNVEDLVLTTKYVTGQILFDLAFNKKLHKINLSYTRVSDTSLEGLGNIRLELRVIKLYGTRISGKGLEEIAKACPHLEEIDLNYVKITGQDLLMVARTCKKIIKLKADDSICTLEIKKALKEIHPKIEC